MEARGKVTGKHADHSVMLYALSTCGWCRKTRRFLESREVAFDYVYVDLVKGQDREDAMTQVRQWNPRASFPTIVVDGRDAIIGYREDELTEALGL